MLSCTTAAVGLILLLISLASAAAVDEACEAPLSLLENASPPPRRATGYLLDVAKPFTADACAGRACLCTLGEDVYLVRAGAVVRLRQTVVGGEAAYDAVPGTTGAQAVACAADGASLVVVTDSAALLFVDTGARVPEGVMPLALNASSASVLAPFRVSGGGGGAVAWRTLVPVTAGGGATDGAASALLAIGAYTADSGVSHQLAALTWTANASYATDGAWPDGHAGGLLVRAFTAPSALRWRTLTAAGVPARPSGAAAAALPTAVVYAQDAAYALEEGSMPVSNDDMVMMYWHADVAPAAASAAAALVDAYPALLEAYGTFTTASRPDATVVVTRRVQRWPHYRNDTALEAATRTDGVRRVVFAPGARTGDAAWLRAHVLSVALPGAGARVNFRETAPRVWQCVLAFNTSAGATPATGTHPLLECQTRHPFMLAATETTTSAWNLLEAMHPRPIRVRAPADAVPVDVFAVNFRVGALQLFVSDCADLGAGDILHQTVHLSAGGGDALPEGSAAAGAAFWAEARPEYPDREGWDATAGAWNASAALVRHSYDAGIGALAPLFTRQSLCQSDVGAGAPDDDANTPEALEFAVVRHMDSTPSGLVWIGTGRGLARYQLVPAAPGVRVEASSAAAGAATVARGAVLETLRADWPAAPNATVTLRLAGAAPAAARVQVDLVRVSDVRPANQSFVVALGTSDACRSGAHTLALDLRALRDWLVDGLYTLRLLETYALVDVGATEAVRNSFISAPLALQIDGYAVEVSADVGMMFLSVRTLALAATAAAAATHTALDLSGGGNAGDDDDDEPALVAPVQWWDVPGGAAALEAGANTTLLPASVRVSSDGEALYALTATHLVRLPRPFQPWGLLAATANLTWDAIAWPLPQWCANGTWDSVALDSTEPAFAVACTYDASPASAWAPTLDNATGRGAYPTGGAWNPPPGWPHGDTNAALYVWTPPAANRSLFGDWRSIALEQGPPSYEDGTARLGRVRLLAVDSGFAEVMHWYGADPYTFGVTHYAPWPAPLRALSTGAVHTEVYAVRAQDEWALGARRGGAALGSAATVAPAATTALLYSLPATSYVANSNLLQADRVGSDAPYDWPWVRAPRAQPEVRWSTAPGTEGVDPDGKRAAVFFPPAGGAVVVCAYESAADVGSATQLGLYTNGPCRATPLSAAASARPVVDAQVVGTPSVSVLLVTADDGANVTLSTLLVDRDLAVYVLGAVDFATTYAGARRALVYTGLGVVAFADWEFAFDAVSGRINATSARRVTDPDALPAPGATWVALSVSERTLVWVDAATGALGARGTRVRTATDSAWPAPGSTAQTYLGCGLASACAAAGLGTPRRTADASLYATDVYPASALLAPAFVRPWAGAADWYTAGYTPPRAVAADDAAPWFHAETRYRLCASAAERPRRYAGAPDVWTCYRDAARDGARAAHPRRDTGVASCGGGFTASVSVDWPPRDGRWDAMQTLCHLTVRAPCANASANIHCVVTDGVEASVGWFAPEDVFPVASRFRFPALEAAGVAPATRLRMCRGPELLHACLMDERACLAVEGVGVVAVSCDAALWAAYTPEQTALWDAAEWRAHIAAGALAWQRPANLRLSYAVGGVPVHEGTLHADEDTIALVLPAALAPAERNCTAAEAVCAETGRAALTCRMTEQRSATSGRHVFAWPTPGARQCAPVPLPGLLALQAQPVTAAQARALCGPCWAETPRGAPANAPPTPAPVATSWDAATGAPLTVDSASCACSACAPAWNDSRPCATPNAEAACATDGDDAATGASFFSAVRLCGPSALGCTYACSAASYGAPVCAARNCVCAYYSSDPRATLPCIPAPEACTAAELVAQCGPWAATCTRHTDNARQSYECTGLPGAVRDSTPARRFTTPPYAAVASARLVLGAGSGAALRVAALPDADRDPDLRGGVPHWDCGWTSAYLRAQRVVNPATGARFGYAGYEQWNTTAASSPDAHPLLQQEQQSLCTDVDGTLGTGLLLLSLLAADAGGSDAAVSVWDGAAGANGTLLTGVSAAALVASGRAVLPASGALASEAARYVALTNSPCDGVAGGAQNTCRAGVAGRTRTLVGGGGRRSREIADADGVLRFTVYDTVPGATYTVSWAAVVALVRRRADGLAASAAFTATGGASVYRVRVSDADTGGAVVYSDALVTNVTATDWVDAGVRQSAPALVARGGAVWVDFMRVRGPDADVQRCADAIVSATAAALGYATEVCTEAADADPFGPDCVADRAVDSVSVSGSASVGAFLAACGLELVGTLEETARPYVRRVEGTRLLLVDDLQVVRAVAAGDDGGYAPWATWRAPGVSVRLDFATSLRDATGVSVRGGGYLETAPGTPLDFAAGAYTAADTERPNGAVRAEDGVPVAGLNATVLRMAARDAGVAWLALPDVAPHPREYTKSVWVRFGAGGDAGYADADPGAYTALLADAFAPSAFEARTGGAGLSPVNGFGVWGGAWLYCGAHRVARDLSEDALAALTSAADRGWMPWTAPQTAALPPGARLRVNATWLSQWHHLVCRARALAPDEAAPAGMASPARRLVEYALYVDGAPVGARANGDATGPVVAVRPEAWELALAAGADAGTTAQIEAPAVYRVGGVPAWTATSGARPQAPSHVDNPTVYARALADGEIAQLYLYDGDVDGAVPSARAFVARCAGGLVAAYGVCEGAAPARWSTAAFPVQFVFPVALDANATLWGPLPAGGAANATTVSAADLVAAALAAYPALGSGGAAHPSLALGLGYEAALAARMPAATGVTGCLRAAHAAGFDAAYFGWYATRTAAMQAQCRWSAAAYPWARGAGGVIPGAVYSTLALAQAACLVDATCASVQLLPADGTWQLHRRHGAEDARATLAAGTSWLLACTRPSHTACGVYAAPDLGAAVWADTVALRAVREILPRTPQLVRNVTNGQCVTLRAPAYDVVAATGPNATRTARLQTGGAGGYTRTAWVRFTVQCESPDADARAIIYPDCVAPAETTQALDPATVLSGGAAAVDTGAVASACVDCDPAMPRWVVRAPVYTGCDSAATGCVPEMDPDSANASAPVPLFYTYTVSVRCSAVAPVAWVPPVPVTLVAPGGRGSVAEAVCGAYATALVLACNQTAATGLTPVCRSTTTAANASDPALLRGCVCPVMDARAADLGLPPCQVANASERICYASERAALGCDRADAATVCRLACTPAGCALTDKALCYNQSALVRADCDPAMARALCGPEYDAAYAADRCTVVGYANGPGGARYAVPGTEECTCAGANPAALAYWRALLEGASANVTGIANTSASAAWIAARTDAQASCACKGAVQIGSGANASWTCPRGVLLPCTAAETNAACAAVPARTRDPYTVYVAGTLQVASSTQTRVPMSARRYLDVDVSTANPGGLAVTVAAARGVQTQDRCQRAASPAFVSVWDACPAVADANATLRTCSLAEARRECGDETRGCVMRCIRAESLGRDALAGFRITDITASITNPTTNQSALPLNVTRGVVASSTDLKTAIALCMSDPGAVKGAQISYIIANATAAAAAGSNATTVWQCWQRLSSGSGSVAFTSPTTLGLAYNKFLAARAGAVPAVNCTRWGVCATRRACTAVEARTLCGLVPGAGAPAPTAADGLAPAASLARVGYYADTRDDVAPAVSYAESGGARWSSLAGDYATGCVAYEEQTAVGVRVTASNCTWACPDGFFGAGCSQSANINATCTPQQALAMCGAPWTTTGCTTDAYGVFRCTCAAGWGPGARDNRACSGAARVCGAARGDVARWAGAFGANCTVACQGGAYHEATGPAVGAWVDDATGTTLTAAGVAAGLVGPEDAAAPVPVDWPTRWLFGFEDLGSAALSWRAGSTAIANATSASSLLTWSIATAAWTSAEQAVNDSLVWVPDMTVGGAADLRALGGAGRIGGAYDLLADTTHTVWCTPTAPRDTVSLPGTAGENFTVSAWWFRHTSAAVPAGVTTVLLAAAYSGNTAATPPWALVYDTGVSPARLRVTFAASASNPGATGAGPSCTEGASGTADGACLPAGAWVHLVATYGVFRALDTRYVGAYALWAPTDASGTCPSVTCVAVWWSTRAAQALALGAAIAARAPASYGARMCMCPMSTGAGNADALVLRAPGTAAAALVSPGHRQNMAQTNAGGALGPGGAAFAVATDESRDSLKAACAGAYALATGDTGTSEATLRASVWCAALVNVDDAALACGVGAFRAASALRTAVTIQQVAQGCGLAALGGFVMVRLRGYDYGAPVALPNPTAAGSSLPTECAVFGGTQSGVASALPQCDYELGPLAGVARGARFSTFHYDGTVTGASPCTGASTQSYALFITESATTCGTLRGTVAIGVLSEATGEQVVCRLTQCGWVRDDDVAPGDSAARTRATLATAALYRDGVRLAQTQWTPASVGGIPVGPTSPVCIGSRAYATPWGVSPRGTPAPMPALLDDLRGIGAALTAPQVRALRALERTRSVLEAVSAGRFDADETCVLGRVACLPNGAEDAATGLVCGTNKQRVRIVATTSDTTTTDAAPARLASLRRGVGVAAAAAGRAEKASSLVVATVTDATFRPARRVWRATSNWVVGDRSGSAFAGSGGGGGGTARVRPSVLITVDATNADALAALRTRCGEHAVSGEIDVPKSDATGALLFNQSSPTGGACFCAPGWYTELARYGFSATDPAGTGPCTEAFRGRACTKAESDAVPWTALRRSCDAGAPFRCWVLCTGAPGVDETCATFTSQGCLDREIANATCSPATAAAMCPKPAAVTQQNVAYDWQCRGACTFRSAFASVADIAAMQTCSSVYECVGSARSASEVAWVPTASLAQAPTPTNQRVYYASVPCSVLPGRQPWQFCGAGAVDCALRCDPGAVTFTDGVVTSVTNADACYAFDTCTCATATGALNATSGAAAVNGTTRATTVQTEPCDGTGVSAAEIVARCGPFATSATRFGCTAPGVGCTYSCACQPGTGPMVAPANWDYANGAWSALPCSAYLKPCDGPADATEWCAGTSAAALIANVVYAYASCTLACTPHVGTCASPPCWKQDCRVVPGTCAMDSVNRPTVTLIGPGGVPYAVNATTPGLFDRPDPACTCDARTYLMYPSREGYTANGWCAPSQECSELAWSSVSPSGVACSATGTERVAGCCTPTNSPQAGASLRFGQDPVKPVLRDGTPWECATLCPTPSQHCTIAAVSHAIGCGPNLRLVSGSCFNDGSLSLAVCQLPGDLLVGAAAYVDGGPAPQCSCASGCPGCSVAGPNGTVVPMSTADPAASRTPCPVAIRALQGLSACAPYCPAGTQTCTVNYTWIGNRTALCGNSTAFQGATQNPCSASLTWSTPDYPQLSAPLPRVISCGTAWLDTPAATGAVSASVGGVRFSSKLDCSPEEARRWCGPAAVGCKIFDGVVQLADCVCRAGADVRSPVGDESVLDAPFYGSYCIGDGDAVPCTPTESEAWCGETATNACVKRRLMVSADYAASVNAQLDSAKRATAAYPAGAPVCKEWRVPLTSLAPAALARAWMLIDEMSATLDMNRVAYPLQALDSDYAQMVGSSNATLYTTASDLFSDIAGGYVDGLIFRSALGFDALSDADLMNCSTGMRMYNFGPFAGTGTVLSSGYRDVRTCDAAVYTTRRNGKQTAVCIHRSHSMGGNPGYVAFDPSINWRTIARSGANIILPAKMLWNGYTTYPNWQYQWNDMEGFADPSALGKSCGLLFQPGTCSDGCPFGTIFGNQTAPTVDCFLNFRIAWNNRTTLPSVGASNVFAVRTCTPGTDSAGASLYSAAALDAYHLRKAAATNASTWRHLFEARDFAGLNTWLSSVIRNGLTFTQLQDVGAGVLANATPAFEVYPPDPASFGYWLGRPDTLRWAAYAALYNASNMGRFDGLPNPANADVAFDPLAGPSPLHVCASWGDPVSAAFPPSVAAADRVNLRKSYLGALFAADGARVPTAGWDNPSGTAAGAKATAVWLPECTCFSNSSDMRARGAFTKLNPVVGTYGWRDLGAYADTPSLVADVRCDAKLLRATATDPSGGICPVARNGLACAGVGTCNPGLSLVDAPASCTSARSACIANRLASVPDWPLMRPYGAVAKSMSPTILVCGDDAKPAFMLPIAAASALVEGVAPRNYRVRAAAYYAARKFVYGTTLVSPLGPWQGTGVAARYSACMRIERRAWYTPSASTVCQRDARAGAGSLPVQFRRIGCLSSAELDAFPIANDTGVPRPLAAWLAANRLAESRNGDANDVRTAYAQSCATGDAMGTNGSAAVNCPQWTCTVPRVDSFCSSTGTGFVAGCPLGRGGPDCGLMAQSPASLAVPSPTAWDDAKYQRMRLWGIANLGTPCQSWKYTNATYAQTTTVSDGAEGVDCTARDLRTGAYPNTTGRAGCVNGAWSWSDAACVCDLGWSRPRDLYASRRAGWTGVTVDTTQCFPPGTLPTGAWEAAVYGLWDAHAKTVPEIASAFWMCVVPGADDRLGSQASACTTNGAAPTAAECLAAGACPVCNGRGTCVTGQGCVCQPGWYGRQCQLRTAELCATTTSLVGVARLPLVDPATGDPLTARGCSGHGTCVLTNSTCTGCGAEGIRAPDCCTVEGHCECVSGRGYGWAGVNCSRPYLDIVTGYVNGSVATVSQADACLNGGVMDADAPPALDNATGVAVGHRVWCNCPAGWTGMRCELSACPVSANGLQCNGHGTCAFDVGTQKWSCQQPWACSQALSDPNRAKCTKFTQYRYACIEPGGFTAANPPGRWRGAACEIDTMRWCGASGDGGQTWSVCNGYDIRATTAVAADGAYQDACVAVPSDATTTTTTTTTTSAAYYCRCSDIEAGLSGAHCELSACSNPAIGAGDTCGSLSPACVAASSSASCTARPRLCVNGVACVCTDENLDASYDTPSKRLFMNLGNDPSQPWCSEDVTACGAYINTATREFRATAANLGGSFGWGLFRCKAGAGAAVRGVCARDMSRAGAPYACFCDAALTQRCADNRCLTCAADNSSSVPLPTFAVAPPTAAPTAVPTTAAPTAPSTWNFAYQPLFGGDAPGEYLLAPGVPIPGGGAIYGVRSGVLHADTAATFAIAPALPAGLALDADSGNITGTPAALSTTPTVYAVTVAFAPAQSAVFTLTLAVDEPCGDGAGCGAHGTCVRTDGAAHATCVCTGRWTRFSATDTRSMCLNHTCTPPSVPGDAPEVVTAAAAASWSAGAVVGGLLNANACICATNPAMTPESACAAPGCTSDPRTGELCGPTMAYDRAVGANGTAPGKVCAVAYAAATGAATYACACSGAYARNATSGRCVPLCDTENTERVVALTNAPAGAAPAVGVTVACVPRPNGLQPWDPATGNVYRWCMHNASLDAATQSRCVCAWPFVGSACTVQVPAPDGSARTVSASRTGAQCECASCGAHGDLNCTVGRDETRCAVDGSAPACVCRGLAYGASCEAHPCNAALGGALAPDGLACVCGGGDPAHAYGGPYCNVSRCAHGAPVQRTAEGLYRCVCPADPNVDPRTTDALCAGTCVANAERLTDTSPCTCVPPYGPAASGTGCTTRCGVAAGTLYGSWPLVPAPQCFCTPPYNATTNANCTCDPGQPVSQCVVAGRCNPAYAALAGTGTRAVLRGARHCVCEVPTRWRGLYCSESACGPMGVPVSSNPGSPSGWQYPADCDCDPAQPVKALKRARKVSESLVATGQVWCQPAPQVFDCNGGTFNTTTGRCACTADCTGDPWCDNCPGRVGGGAGVIITTAPTSAPTVAPTGAPTRAPTASPTASPTTSTGGGGGGTTTDNPAACTGAVDPSGALVSGGSSTCNATEPVPPGNNAGGDQGGGTDRDPTPPSEEVGGGGGGEVDVAAIAGGVVGGVVGIGALYLLLRFCRLLR